MSTVLLSRATRAADKEKLKTLPRLPAYVFCVLEALHAALRRRDVYAVGADKWGDPRARLIEARLGYGNGAPC